MKTVDVILCCYNQQDTIEKALRSVYAQEADAHIHLIVADDSSTDDTLKIIEALLFAPSHTSFEKEILDKEHNLGISKNYLRAFEKCKGEYVFILEGDDWWLPNHLQQHLDFLESHKECSMSANIFSRYDVRDSIVSYPYSDEDDSIQTFNIEDQIQRNRLGNLSACCFRGEHIRNLPEKLSNYSFADWLMGMIMAEHGLIAILPETTSVWRISGKSAWTGLKGREVRKRMINGYRKANEYFDYKYNDTINKAIKTWMHPSLNIKSWRDFVPKVLIRIGKLLLGRL